MLIKLCQFKAFMIILSRKLNPGAKKRLSIICARKNESSLSLVNHLSTGNKGNSLAGARPDHHAFYKRWVDFYF